MKDQPEPSLKAENPSVDRSNNKADKKPALNTKALLATLALAIVMLVWLFSTQNKEPPATSAPGTVATETETTLTDAQQSPAADNPAQASSPATELKPLQLPALADDDYNWIAARIFENEAASEVRYLTFWGEGEDFPSFGIGHFIWFPAGVDAPFDEQFPDMVAYVSQRTASEQPLPEWMQQLVPFDAPWANKQVFDNDWSSDEMTALRDWLQATAQWQARYIVATFERRWQGLDLPADQKAQLTTILQQLAGSAAGLFAIIDYYNFKGLGVNPRERYQGQGWGLIQVLTAMPAFDLAVNPVADATTVDDTTLLEQFTQAAGERLSLRVELAPEQRNEQRWLAGWLKRLQGYLSVELTIAE